LIKKIRLQAPLVHHITNWVTIYDCAQITRSVGALPIMAHMKEEVADMVGLSHALVLNIGTLSGDLLESMLEAGSAANSRKVPIVLDIVGCGATPARKRAVEKLIDHLQLSIIKGNSGEIGAAAGAEAEVKGVESISVRGNITEIARQFSEATGAVVVVTGATDIITNGTDVHVCNSGHPMMSKVVGTGCMAASLLGAFAGVAGSCFDAAVCAMNFYGIAGEKAASEAMTPMAYKAELIDWIYRMANR
jgi:hydroxyethylthiazole kinase